MVDLDEFNGSFFKLGKDSIAENDLLINFDNMVGFLLFVPKNKPQPLTLPTTHSAWKTFSFKTLSGIPTDKTFEPLPLPNGIDICSSSLSILWRHSH